MKKLLLMLLCLPFIGMAQNREYEITILNITDSIAECSLKTKYVVEKNITVSLSEVVEILDECDRDSVYFQSSINALNVKCMELRGGSAMDISVEPKLLEEIDLLYRKMGDLQNKKDQYTKVLNAILP